MYPDEPTDFFRIRVDRMSIHVGFAPAWLQERRDNSHGRRFTSPIRADESEKIPFVQLQVDGLNGKQVTILFRQIFCFDHRLLPSGSSCRTEKLRRKTEYVF